MSDYDRGFFAAVDKMLALIQSIESNGPEFRKEVYEALMVLRPSLSQKLLNCSESVSEKDLSDVPADLSENLDEYLYGDKK